MSGSTTPRLALPYVAAGQASPEVALATSLNRLDCLTQGVVQSVGTNTPPGSPAQGATYLLGASPTGAWAGRANDVAYFVGTGWVFFDPSQGWEFFNVADAARYRWSGSAWGAVGGARQTTLRRSGNLSLVNNTATLVTWDTEDFDDDNAHDNAVNPSRITVPAGRTRGRFRATISFALNTTGTRYLQLERNSAGTPTAANQVIYKGAGAGTTGGAADYGTLDLDTGWIPVTASDHYEIIAVQTSGGALNLIGGTLPRGSVFQAEFV